MWLARRAGARAAALARAGRERGRPAADGLRAAAQAWASVPGGVLAAGLAQPRRAGDPLASGGTLLRAATAAGPALLYPILHPTGPYPTFMPDRAGTTRATRWCWGRRSRRARPRRARSSCASVSWTSGRSWRLRATSARRPWPQRAARLHAARRAMQTRHAWLARRVQCYWLALGAPHIARARAATTPVSADTARMPNTPGRV